MSENNENAVLETDEEYEVLDVNALDVVKLGRQGENDTQAVQIDCSDWLEQLPACDLMIVAKRNGEKAVYVPSVTVSSGVIIWPVLSVDTEKAGYGQAEVRASLNGKIKKSKIFRTLVEKALDGPEATPAELPDWVQDVKDAAEDAEEAAQAAQTAAETAAGVVLDAVVRNDVSQALAEKNRAQARSNIGALGPMDVGQSNILYALPLVTAEAGEAPVAVAVYEWLGPFESGQKVTMTAGTVTGAQSADSCLCVALMAGETVIRRVYGGASGTTAEIAGTDLSADLDRIVFQFTPQQTGTMAADASAADVACVLGEAAAFTPADVFEDWIDGKLPVATLEEVTEYLGL